MLGRLLRRDGDGSDEALTIEPMRRKHLAEIMTIEQDAYPRPWTQNVFVSELEMARRDERTYLVARRGGVVVGYGGVMYAIDDGHITNIAVAPDLRRSGIATRLLAELAWAAIRRRCVALTLEVRVSNVAAQALYRSFGFAPAGVRSRYYENVEDAIVMWCNDILTPSYRERLAELCLEAAR